MPAPKSDKIQVTCPHCGHTQAEPRMAISTVCKKCRGHIRIEDLAKPSAKPKIAKLKKAEPTEPQRKIKCFDCGTDLEVAPSAESTMCKRCGSYMDLKDYHISSAVSKNFKTRGIFVVEPKGYVFNTEATVAEAVIKGRFLGKLFAERSLTIYSTAEIKGSFKAGQLVIPADNHFRWREPISVASAEIAGELANDLHVEGAVVLKSTAKLFGDIEATNLVVESGAVVVGHMKIGPKKS